MITTVPCVGNSIIAAVAVVASDVRENVIVGGNPAKVIKHI
jgi:acetyltransferase-like isoleucine patch superfamily enzyme